MRHKADFNEDWYFKKTAEPVDASFSGEGWEQLSLPHTWNALDGQDGGNDYWRGTASYVKTFAKPALASGECAFLQFDGAAMTADVYVNGQKLVHHEGGYSTFYVEITEALQEENILWVTVDNSENDCVYPQKADFTFYGGLYRPVSLITVPAAHFALDGCKPDIKVTPVVDLAAHRAAVSVETWQNGDEAVTVSVDGQSVTLQPENGYAKAEFTLEDVHLWDGADDPYLYTASAKTSGGDEICARFGCRTIEFKPDQGFFLNGRSYPLRGVSRHQDRKGLGNALTMKEHEEDIALIREIGATTVRLAHYQQAQEFYDLCDENGLIVWAEIPYISMHMPNGRANTLSQMRELVTQCCNHPSIVCWGLSNEITAASGVTDDMLENHRLLNDLCHELDATRSTTMANVFMLETDSPILEIPDINSYNLYFGWYLGELEENEAFFDEFHEKYPNRVIGFSEYGADANPAYQSAKPERGDYTESYQALYHEHILQMIEQRPYLWATHVWNMFDFAADGRDEGGKHGENQKGLVCFDRKMKKDAFYLYKAAWNKKEPFVHICGARYVDRAESVTEIKVYSNQSEVTLLVDGQEIETQKGSIIFRFQVPIRAEHTICASAGESNSVILVRSVSEPNPDYIYNKKGDVSNWFDTEAFDPECYSVQDTLGELAKSPEANAIVQRMMDGAAASRGDVAASVKDNPALQRMMQRMTLQSLLKQAGEAVPPEAVKSLNETLQKIRKA